MMEQTEDRNRSREIVLINRTETKPLSRWNKIEQISRALSLGAIPVVLAIGGWWIQNALSERSVNKDYVALAVSILSKSDKEVDEGLRSWAVDLLNANSPVKFDPKVSQKLSSGEITLPAVSSTFQPITELPENDPRRTIARSIGRLSIAGTEGDFSCSAWLISEEYLLTADFCVDGSPTDIKFTLGSSGENQSNGTTYQVENRPYELNHKLGYAILKVSGAPGAKYGHLRIAATPPQVNDELFLAHYAQGASESFSKPCRITNIAAGGDSFFHNCDTAGGVAGAPLIRVSDLSVIGVHMGRDVAGGNVKTAKRVDAIRQVSAILNK